MTEVPCQHRETVLAGGCCNRHIGKPWVVSVGPRQIRQLAGDAGSLEGKRQYAATIQMKDQLQPLG